MTYLRIRCPECGTVSLKTAVSGPCPICGNTETLQAQEISAAEFFSGAGQETLTETAGTMLISPNTATSAPAVQNLAALMKCIADYKTAASELHRATAAKGSIEHIKKIVLNTSAYTSDPIHERYFADVEKAAETLASSLTETGEEERRAVSDRAIRLLLAGADEGQSFLEGFLQADDGFASLFVEDASDSLLEELHADALSRYFMLLPNQKGLDDRITEILKARGRSPRTSTFWEKYFPALKKRG